MAEEPEERVKLELELPKSEVHIEPAGKPSSPDEDKKRPAREHARKAAAKAQEAEEMEKEAKEKEKKKEEKEEGGFEIAGYKPGEIAKAPLEPPEPKDKKAPNKHQRRVIIFGFILIVIGFILWPLIAFAVGAVFAVAGALVVAFGALVRI